MKTVIKYINIALKYIGLLYYKISSCLLFQSPFRKTAGTGDIIAGAIFGIWFYINPLILFQFFLIDGFFKNGFGITSVVYFGLFIYFFDVKEYWKKYADEYEASCEEEQKKVDRRLKYLFGGLVAFTVFSVYIFSLSIDLKHNS